MEIIILTLFSLFFILPFDLQGFFKILKGEDGTEIWQYIIIIIAGVIAAILIFIKYWWRLREERRRRGENFPQDSPNNKVPIKSNFKYFNKKPPMIFKK